jgi:hypothetical protein
MYVLKTQELNSNSFITTLDYFHQVTKPLSLEVSARDVWGEEGVKLEGAFLGSVFQSPIA